MYCIIAWIAIGYLLCVYLFIPVTQGKRLRSLLAVGGKVPAKPTDLVVRHDPGESIVWVAMTLAWPGPLLIILWGLCCFQFSKIDLKWDVVDRKITGLFRKVADD
jgi:hypothetical protein